MHNIIIYRKTVNDIITYHVKGYDESNALIVLVSSDRLDKAITAAHEGVRYNHNSINKNLTELLAELVEPGINPHEISDTSDQG
jgi:hypothetical protein